MKRKTIKAVSVRTIDWFEDKVVDWNSAGTQYLENGEEKQLHKYHHGFVCDGSITSENGEYVLIFQKLGTKGLLLKNGELLREINRSYYQSSVFEFPAAFVTYKDRTYLIHCPSAYNRLDFEDVETGEILTTRSNENLQDVFHSRLEVSPDNKHLLSKGWVWHPIDIIELYNIEDCFKNPNLLDDGTMPDIDGEICSASFIDNTNILVYEKGNLILNTHLVIWNFNTNEISKSAKTNGDYGNIFAIDNKKCWDLYKYPKIIDLKTGEIIDKLEEVNSGRQNSSIIPEDLPKIAFNKKTKQIAIATDNKIEILTV